MTCIIGLIDERGKGHIACDSLGSNGWTQNIYKNQKIFRKGKMLIGYTSSYRMGQLLEHQLMVPARKVDQTIESYIYVDFANAVRALFKDNGYLKVDNNQESIGTFLIIFEGRLFIMENDLAILESRDGFNSCGSGSAHAIAALHTLLGHSKLSPKKMLVEAVNIASMYVSSVGGDINYLGEE